MMNLTSRVIAYISSLFQRLQLKRFLATGLIGFLLLTTGVAFGQSNPALAATIDESLQQDTADRPKTTGEWNQEARETKGKPGERLQRIGKESAEAFKQFGSGYKEGAKETASDIKKNTVGSERS